MLTQPLGTVCHLFNAFSEGETFPDQACPCRGARAAALPATQH
jgi:hypothetical protein